MSSWISFLVTGPEESLMDWQFDAMGLVELFDRRGQTVRCRAHIGPPFLDLPAWKQELDAGKIGGIDRAEALLERAVALARTHDVTVQRLESEAGTETYPVLWIGSHGMKWPPPEREGKRKQTHTKEGA